MGDFHTPVAFSVFCPGDLWTEGGTGRSSGQGEGSCAIPMKRTPGITVLGAQSGLSSDWGAPRGSLREMKMRPRSNAFTAGWDTPGQGAQSVGIGLVTIQGGF